MIINANGKDYTPPDLLMYWIQERYRILTAKANGGEKPWSPDPVFQNTYFCNVRREDDKVTRFIRERYTQTDHDLFEFNMVLARFLNRPSTLQIVGFIETFSPGPLKTLLKSLASEGPIWGNAYIITTHGMPMDKLDYLCDYVLSDVYERIEAVRGGCRGPTCRLASMTLQEIDGIGSFLAGQVVADLKNTPGHALQNAFDREYFVEPGPGSLRGLHWFLYGTQGEILKREFPLSFKAARDFVDCHWPEEVPKIDNQDLQNCLCEFDKYCRVVTGVGRSKRNYNGR